MHADTNADAGRAAAVWAVLAEGELWAKHVVIRLCQDVPDRVKRDGATAVLEAASQTFAAMMEGVAA